MSLSQSCLQYMLLGSSYKLAVLHRLVSSWGRAAAVWTIDTRRERSDGTPGHCGLVARGVEVLNSCAVRCEEEVVNRSVYHYEEEIPKQQFRWQCLGIWRLFVPLAFGLVRWCVVLRGGAGGADSSKEQQRVWQFKCLVVRGGRLSMGISNVNGWLLEQQRSKQVGVSWLVAASSSFLDAFGAVRYYAVAGVAERFEQQQKGDIFLQRLVLQCCVVGQEL
ncbi:unnamed protein product [Closterium sp. Yama58-4]|nr:unnamed protein product [Closterium sp. Yama58-4]